MLLQCFVTVVDNPASLGGVFLLAVAKEEPHRCWHKWFESGAVAGREAHALGIASEDCEPAETRQSRMLGFKILPLCDMDSDKLDADWETGRPSELRRR